MPETSAPAAPFNILAVAQAGRLEHEAVLLAASLRRTNPDWQGVLYLAEPQPGPLWPKDPRIGPATRALLAELGAVLLPFESRHFGADYPYGNKIEALAALPEAPFLFLDTDTLVTGALDTLEFDFLRPSASMRREGTWPKIELYGPGYGQIWGALYAGFGLDFATSLDLSQPDEFWQRYLYFNAGWFFHASPRQFGARFAEYALALRDRPPPELALQEMDPWLDQIALPLVIHALGGGRPGPGLAGLDGAVTCHYRSLSLLYARESDRAVAVLEEVAADRDIRRCLRDWEPARVLIYQNRGRKARQMFDRSALPHREQAIRNALKRAGLWFR